MATSAAAAASPPKPGSTPDPLTPRCTHPPRHLVMPSLLPPLQDTHLAAALPPPAPWPPASCRSSRQQGACPIGCAPRGGSEGSSATQTRRFGWSAHPHSPAYGGSRNPRSSVLHMLKLFWIVCTSAISCTQQKPRFTQAAHLNTALGSHIPAC